MYSDVFFFFFKQKTAYEMRISDWSSDVCSSDLLIGVYGLDIATAGALAAIYIIPASVFRHYGGKLSDRYGARAVMYVVLGISVLCIFMLAYPPTTYIIDSARGPISFRTEMGLAPFLVTMAVLGFFMSLGKAAVFDRKST